MSFNQWASGRDLDGPLRFAFQALWQELADRGCVHVSSLLTDLFDAMPQPEFADEEDLF
jgi:hypothetical protein